MAKKKSKKSAQKQVEVLSPPDNIEPATAVATEEPSANEATPDVPGPSLAPPPEVTNGEVTDGPTSVPGPDLEDVHAEPREDGAPVVEEVPPSSLVDDHVETNSPVSEQPLVTEERPTVTEEEPIVAGNELVATEEEPIVTEEEPIVTEEVPIVTEEEPIVTEEEPIATEEEPIIIEEEPIIVEEEPIVIEEEPVVVEEEPVVIEEEPVVVEEEPLVTETQEQLVVTEAVEPPHETSVDLVDAQLDTTSEPAVVASAEPILEEPLDGEPHSDLVEEQADLFSPVEPQPVTILEDVSRTDEAHDEDQVAIEAPPASDPTVEPANIESPEGVESALDQSDETM
jgi:hypothetical protein